MNDYQWKLVNEVRMPLMRLYEHIGNFTIEDGIMDEDQLLVRGYHLCRDVLDVLDKEIYKEKHEKI